MIKDAVEPNLLIGRCNARIVDASQVQESFYGYEKKCIGEITAPICDVVDLFNSMDEYDKRDASISKRIYKAIDALCEMALLVPVQCEWYDDIYQNTCWPIQSSKEQSKAIVDFVENFGPLASHWDRWCKWQEYSVLDDPSRVIPINETRHQMREYLRYTSELSKNGITSTREPVWFYFQAAVLVKGLRDFPNSKRSLEFLQVALNGMRLLSPIRIDEDAYKGLRLYGLLLSHIAYYAAFDRKRKVRPLSFHPGVCRNPNCKQEFNQYKKSVHYCEECRANKDFKNIQNNTRQHDYRNV